MTPSKTDIKNALSAGKNKIGSLTWYDCRNAHITPAQLAQLFSKFNLDEKYMPDTIKPKHAFQKACRQAMKDDSPTSDTRRSITRIIVDGSEKIIYGVVDLDVNQTTESINPDFSDSVWLNKQALTVEYEHGHRTSLRVKKIYDQLCGEYTTRDISRMIVKSVEKMAAVSLRDGGVVYFIPNAYDSDLQALQSVVNSLGQCNMRLFTIGSDDNNSDGIVKEAKSQINNKIKAMMEDIGSLKESIENKTIQGKTIENSIKVRLSRFRELKDKCSVLADALKIKAETLEGELDKVGKLIKTDLEDIV